MEIGVLAGKIWKTLEKDGAQTATSLVKTLTVKNNDLMMALGWLLREDKLEITKVGNTTKYSLK
jgi:hypothetical protein